MTPAIRDRQASGLPDRQASGLLETLVLQVCAGSQATQATLASPVIRASPVRLDLLVPAPQVRLDSQAIRGIPVTQELQDQLDSLVTRARRALLDRPGLQATPGRQELRATLALLERTVSLVRQDVLDRRVPQDLPETLETQAARALQVIPDLPGRQALLALMELLVTLVLQASD